MTGISNVPQSVRKSYLRASYHVYKIGCLLVRGISFPAAQQQTTNFIYIMITRPEIWFMDRPQNIRNPGHIILPIMTIMYFGLSKYCIIRFEY